MLTQLLNILAPVAIAAAIGFFWERRGPGFDVKLVSALATVVGTPCLVFSTLASVEIDLNAFFEMAAATVVTLVAFLIISALVFRFSGVSQKTFLPSMVFANTGNMGLPLCLLAFGADGLAFAIVYFTIHLILLFSVGEVISAGSITLGKLARQPVLYAVAAAVFFLVTGYEVPVWIDNTTTLLGDFTIPLMLITLGVSLAGLEVGGFSRSILLSLLRLGMGFGVGLLTAHLFGLEGAAAGALILQSTMPVAVFNYLFAVKNDNSPSDVAGVIVTSTAISAVTLPLLLWFLLQ